MAIHGVQPKVQLMLGRTGTPYAAKLTVTVEDAQVRKVQGNAFDGLEKVFALLTRQDGTPEKVELKYRQSVDPAPGLAVDSSPKPANVGPHSGEGPRLVSAP